MTERALSKEQRERLASAELAERLDALTKPMADRILGRAVELDAAAKEAADEAAATIDYDTLKDIALEVGIGEEALQRAVLEEFDTDKDRNPGVVGKLTVPDTITGGLVVPATLDEMVERVRQAVAAQANVRTRPDGFSMEWNGVELMRRPQMRTTVRTWDVPQRRHPSQLVEVEVDTKSARRKAWRWILGLFVLATLFGSSFGGLLLLAGFWLAAGAAAVGWMKRISRRARRFVNRLLDDITGGSSTETDPSWLDLWERLPR